MAATSVKEVSSAAADTMPELVGAGYDISVRDGSARRVRTTLGDVPDLRKHDVPKGYSRRGTKAVMPPPHH